MKPQQDFQAPPGGQNLAAKMLSTDACRKMKEGPLGALTLCSQPMESTRCRRVSCRELLRLKCKKND